ncbi:Geraniol 8-hydroxylase [Linum grandiflorum]
MDLLLIISCLLCLLTTFSILLRFFSNQTPANLPPGPPRLPIIGNLHNLGDKPHKSLAHLASIHGPLMSLKLGQVTTIVASSPSTAKQILQKHDAILSDRQLILAIRAHDHHEHGLPWVPVGPKWRNLRKVCNTYLFTTQKLDSNQDLRSRKIHELLESVRRNASQGKAVNIGEVAFRTTFGALSTTVLSLDLTDERSSKDAREFKEVARSIMDEAGKPNLGDYFPVLGKLDLQGIHRRMRTHFGKVLNLFGRVIDERLKDRKSEAYVTCNDMLDTLLDIVDQENAEASMDLDLIKHLFFQLIRNPNTFARTRDELDQVIGKDDHLQESNILRLPYLQAIIKETFRLHPPIPLLLPRKAGADVEVSGFSVPKGAQIMVNAWAIGRDSATWGNPNAFMPERFMGSDVDVKGNSFELVPFGGGRRICPGLPLAMRMLHMMLASSRNKMELLLIISCLLCLLTTFAILLRDKTPANLPPGPSRLPIIGNLHNLGDKPHKSLAQLAKIHGPIMSLKLGQVTTIVASSSAVAKQILQKHDRVLSNRHLTQALCASGHHEYGMSLLPAESSKWKNLRKVCNTYIFATQKLDSNQDLRRKKIEEFLESVRRNASEGKAVDIGKAVFRASLSAMSMMVISLDLNADEGSQDVVEFMEATRGIMDEAGKPNLGDFFPLVGVLDLQGIQRRMRSHSMKLLSLFGRIIEERLEKRKSEKYVTSNDMMDTLLDIANQENHEASMDLDLIKHLFLDLFVAGTDTISSTLEWLMAELLRNPNTFVKARKELDQIIGKDNHLHESDFIRLPFLQAIIKETLRLHPAGPLLIPRKAGSDVQICGFMVPKGAQVIINAWAIGRDPAIWDNPDVFMPERFIESKIDVGGNNFEFIPFGGGRRICPGLPLVMRMLHMIVGSLIHRFDWKLKDGVELMNLDMEDKFGITLEKAEPLIAFPIAI